MQPPVVQQLSDIIGGLNSVYDPQRAAANQGVATTQQDATNAEQGINAQKDQAFQGITNTAQGRGMLFSGFAPDQQAKYTAATYLPSLVKLHATANDNIAKLQQNILSLNASQQTQAQGIQQGQQKNLQDYQIQQQQAAVEQAKMQQALQIAQMSNQTKLQAAGITAGASSANAANTAANKLASQYKAAKFTSGNYNFTGPNGRPVSLAQYADATGAGPGDVLSLLANGSSYDKNIYNKVKSISDPGTLLSALKTYDKSNFYGFN